MKKTIVAVAVAALAATSANAATVYNQDGSKLDISGSVRVMLNKTTDHRADLQNDGSRVEVSFSQNLGEGFSALGYMEFRPTKTDNWEKEDGKLVNNADDNNFGDGIYTHYIYAGLSADNVGTLTFGKQTTAADDFKLADPTEQGWTTIDAANVATDAKKVINFTSASWEGFAFRTSYTFDDDSSKAAKNPNKPTWQGLLTYSNDFDGLGFKANALYSHAKVTDAADETKTDAHKVWGLATAVNYANFGLAVDYTHSKLNDAKVKAWEIAGTYQVLEPMDLYVTYTHAKDENDDKTKAISVGSHYQVAKNVQTYVEYTTTKEENNDRENGYYAGLRVFF